MKDHVEIGHLTKYDAFRVNRDQVMDLEIRFKIHTNVSKAIPIKCFVSHRPTDPCFWRSKKKVHNHL